MCLWQGGAEEPADAYEMRELACWAQAGDAYEDRELAKEGEGGSVLLR